MENTELTISQSSDAEASVPIKRTKIRTRPRVSLQKWALLQNENFPELYYKSIKEMIRDRKTHFLKMSQIMHLIDQVGTMTPIGRVRKRSREERLIHFPNTTSNHFDTPTIGDEVKPSKPKVVRKSKRIALKKSSSSSLSVEVPPSDPVSDLELNSHSEAP